MIRMRIRRHIVITASALACSNPAIAPNANRGGEHWIGTWATAAQASIPAALQTYNNQTLRLIVHTSTGGSKVRIRISNTFGFWVNLNTR